MISTLGRWDAAEVCRANGWTAGTKIIGTEDGRTTSVLRITAVGEVDILAREIERNGKPYYGHEASWSLSCREWKAETE